MANVIFPKTTYNSFDVGVDGFRGFYIDGEALKTKLTEAFSPSEVGQTFPCVVELDGKFYETTVYLMAAMTGPDADIFTIYGYVIGNLSLYGGGDGSTQPDTGEPFLIITQEGAALVKSTEPTHTLAIYDVAPEKGDKDMITYAEFMFGPKFNHFPFKGVIGWKLVNKKIATALPEGYTKLEYLWNTDRAYIDTGYSAPDGFIAELGFAYTDFGTSGGRYIIGAHNTASPYERSGIGANVGSTSYFAMGVGDDSPSTGVVAKLNRRYNLKLSTVKGNSYLDVDGVRVWQSTNSQSRSARTLLLFYNHYSLNSGSNGTMGKLWPVKIYSPTGKLVRNFVPCMNPNGEYGMWDKVEGKFYGNCGTGAFTGA